MNLAFINLCNSQSAVIQKPECQISGCEIGITAFNKTTNKLHVVLQQILDESI